MLWFWGVLCCGFGGCCVDGERVVFAQSFPLFLFFLLLFFIPPSFFFLLPLLFLFLLLLLLLLLFLLLFSSSSFSSSFFSFSSSSSSPFSSPAGASIESATSKVTNVKVTGAGSYVIRLVVVDDAGLQATATVVYTVKKSEWCSVVWCSGMWSV